VLDTVVLGALVAATGGGVLTLWFTDLTSWSGNGGPWLIPLLAGLFIAVGMALLVLSADRRVVIDRSSDTVRFLVQRLAHRRSDEYPLASLRDVALWRSLGGARQSTPFYRIVFLTTAGGRVPWTPYSTSDEGTLATCASAVRWFCGWGSGAAAMGAGGGGSGPAAVAARGTLSGHPVATNWGCRATVLAMFMAAGLGVLGSELYRVATWQPVSARVLSTATTAVRGSTGTGYAPVVRYEYSIGGTRYESDAVLPVRMAASLAWAERLRARFRAGAVVTAYVNPNRASSAFLVREVSLRPLLFVVLPLAISALFAWIVLAQRRQVAAMEQRSVPVVDAA